MRGDKAIARSAHLASPHRLALSELNGTKQKRGLTPPRSIYTVVISRAEFISRAQGPFASLNRERKLAQSIAAIHARSFLALLSVMTFYLRVGRRGLTRQKYTSSGKFARFFFILNWRPALYTGYSTFRLSFSPTDSFTNAGYIFRPVKPRDPLLFFYTEALSLSLSFILAFSLIFTSGSYCCRFTTRFLEIVSPPMSRVVTPYVLQWKKCKFSIDNSINNDSR